MENILIFYRPNLAEVRYMLTFLSQGGALCAYPELLTGESLRLSLITLSFYSLYYMF